MNILICGEYSALCRQLLRRLGKEKNELYYLTGTNKEINVDVPVFQTYRFSYLDDNLVRAIISSKAEVLILMGALDLNFVWGFGDTTAADYTSSMLRTLTAAKNANVKEVIYISSIEIFEINNDGELARNTEPQCNSLRAKTLKRMEQLCMSFADETMQVDIVRLPQVFGEYEKNQENNICLSTSLDYIRNGKMTCFPNIKHMAMYNDDAAEIICKVIRNNTQISMIEDVIESTKVNYKKKYLSSESTENSIESAVSAESENTVKKNYWNLYQFRGYLFTEKELCDALLATGWRKDSAVDNNVVDSNDLNSFCPLEFLGDTQERELGFKIRYTFQEAIDNLCKSLLHYRKEEKKAKKASIKLLPIIETIIFAILAFLLSYITKDMWIGENFNFFIVFVVFIAAVYGTAYGLFASLLGSIGTFILMVLESSFVEVLSGFPFYLQFLLLVVVGVIAGFMRDKFFRRNSTLTEENQYLTTELADITRINDSNLYVKNIYEKRLIEYQNSLARIYELTSQLNVMATQKVIFQSDRVVQEMMNTPHVAIYVSSRRSNFFRLAAAGTEKAQSCGKSIQLNENHFLYSAVASHEIYMNRDFSPERPTFGGAVYDGETPIAIVMVWAEKIEHVNLYESNILAVLCRLIDNAFGRALSYQDALRDKTYLENTSLIMQDSFREIIGIAEDGMKQGLMSYTLLKLDLKGNDVTAAVGLVRDTDYIGVVDGNVYICLSNSNEAEAGFVISRIEKKGYAAELISYEELLDIYEAVNAS